MDTNPTVETLARQITLVINVLAGVDICTDEGKQAMKELRESCNFVPKDPGVIASVQSLYAQVELLCKVLEGVQIFPRAEAPTAMKYLKESLSVRCPVCHKSYTRWPHVRRHIINAKDELHVPLALQLKSTRCDLCGLDLGKPQLKTKHQRKCRPTESTHPPSEHPNTIDDTEFGDQSALRTQSDTPMGDDSEWGDQPPLGMRPGTSMGSESELEDQPSFGTRPDTPMIGNDSELDDHPAERMPVDTRDSPGCLSVQEVYDKSFY